MREKIQVLIHVTKCRQFCQKKCRFITEYSCEANCKLFGVKLRLGSYQKTYMFRRCTKCLQSIIG